MEALKQPDTLQSFVASLGLEYKAEFVPFSKSRNAQEKHKSLNWKVTISKGNQSITTDYMQGIGHIPRPATKAYNPNRVYWYEGYVKPAVEMGRLAHVVGSSISFGSSPLPPPTLQDVMYSLAVDSDVINYSSFEDWAEKFGYDTDSREDESIYRQCLDTALKLRAMLGDSKLQELQEACQDY